MSPLLHAPGAGARVFKHKGPAGATANGPPSGLRPPPPPGGGAAQVSSWRWTLRREAAEPRTRPASSTIVAATRHTPIVTPGAIWANVLRPAATPATPATSVTRPAARPAMPPA